MAPFGAVIFDMDGVLIDSEPIHYAVLSEVLGFQLRHEDYAEFIGTTTTYMWTTLIERYRLPKSQAEYEELYDDAILRALGRPWPIEAGVSALVERLLRQGMPLALASSSKRSWIDATLRSIGLSDAFGIIVAGEDVEHGKPAPDIYLLAAHRLGVPPDRCLAIEDSPNGVLSASRAGMTVLGVRTPYTAHLHLDGAARVVDSLVDVDAFSDWL